MGDGVDGGCMPFVVAGGWSLLTVLGSSEPACGNDMDFHTIPENRCSCRSNSRQQVFMVTDWQYETIQAGDQN